MGSCDGKHAAYHDYHPLPESTWTFRAIATQGELALMIQVYPET